MKEISKKELIDFVMTSINRFITYLYPVGEMEFEQEYKWLEQQIEKEWKIQFKKYEDIFIGVKNEEEKRKLINGFYSFFYTGFLSGYRISNERFTEKIANAVFVLKGDSQRVLH